MSPRVRPVELMTFRQLGEEYGLAPRTAETYGRRLAREYGVVRLPGLRRVFLRREDVERAMSEAGATKWY